MQAPAVKPLFGLPESARMERLSVAYVSAVAAQAGLICDGLVSDFGTDLQVRGVQKIIGDRLIDTSTLLRIQVKSTTLWWEQRGHVVYDAEAGAYNKLVSQDRLTPQILVLFCMPPDPSAWVEIVADGTILRKCAYWWLPDKKVAPSTNRSSKRIKIPAKQAFDVTAIKAMVSGFREGTWP